MDENIICNQIYEIVLDLIKKLPNSLIIKWFEQHQHQLLSRLNLIRLDNPTINHSKKNFITSNLTWDCDSNLFIVNFGGLLVDIINQRNKSKRIKLGQEFTPFHIIEEIIHQLDMLLINFPKKQDLIIFDFACGTGNFIIKILQNELIELEKNIDFSKNKEIVQGYMAKKISTFQNRLYAIDVDPISCYAAEIFSILLILHFLHMHEIECSEDILKGLPAITIIQTNFLQLHNFDAIPRADIILGNPPYLFSRDIPKETRNKLALDGFITAQGQFDLSDVFLEKSFYLLQPGGFLGVIIPETLIFLENRQRIRKFLVENSQKIQIIPVENTFKDVSVENILLFCKKNDLNDINSIELIWDGKTIEKFEKQEILQSSNISIIGEKPITKKILQWLRTHFISINEWNTLNIDNQIHVFRGVELSKYGKIMQCEHCLNWMPFSSKRNTCIHCKETIKSQKLPMSILSNSSTIDSSKLAPFIQSLSRDQFYAEINSYIKLNVPGINYKPLSKYKNRRIIIRQLLTRKKICASISPHDALTSQNIYNIILPKDLNPFIVELTKFLRTDIISYFNYMTFSRGKRLFSRILLKKLKELPWIPRNRDYKIILKVPDEFISEIEWVIRK